MFKKLVLFFSFLCIAQLSALAPIVWDYHDVLYFKPFEDIAKEIFSFLRKTHNRKDVALNAINPAFWYKYYRFQNDENEPRFVETLAKEYPAISVHADALLGIINDDMPITGALRVLDRTLARGIPAILASNMHIDSFEFLKKQKPTFFADFDLIFKARVDGHGKKPDPYYFKQLWDALQAKYGPLTELVPFIDDLAENIAGAKKANRKWGTNFAPIHFKGDAAHLENELKAMGYAF